MFIRWDTANGKTSGILDGIIICLDVRGTLAVLVVAVAWFWYDSVVVVSAAWEMLVQVDECRGGALGEGGGCLDGCSV